jgi:hypothetical protein
MEDMEDMIKNRWKDHLVMMQNWPWFWKSILLGQQQWFLEFEVILQEDGLISSSIFPNSNGQKFNLKFY